MLSCVTVHDYNIYSLVGIKNEIPRSISTSNQRSTLSGDFIKTEGTEDGSNIRSIVCCLIEVCTIGTVCCCIKDYNEWDCDRGWIILLLRRNRNERSIIRN